MKNLVRKSLTALMCASLLMPLAAVELQADEPGDAAVDDVANEEATPKVTPEPATDTSMELPTIEAHDLVLLYSSNVRGQLETYPKMKALKDRLTAEGQAVITLDAGNFMQGDPRLSLHDGETAFEMMRLAAYDVACPCNLEFDLGSETLLAFAEANNLSLVACNLTSETGEELLRPYVIKEVAGEKVAIIGLIDPATRTKAHPQKTQSLKFLTGEEMYEACRQAVSSAREEGASRVVLLSNLGLNANSSPNRLSDVLENVSGIDLAIDSTSDSSEAEIASTLDSDHINDTLILSTSANENLIGEVSIHPDATVEHIKLTIDQVTEADSAVQERINEIEAEVNDEYSAVLGTSQVELFGDSAKLAPFSETAAGQLIADSIRWKFKQAGQDCDIALVNSSAICASIPAGEVTKKDIKALLPYQDQLVLIEVQGSALLEALEAASADADAFPQVSGLKFNFDAAVPYDAGDFYDNSSYRKPQSIQRMTQPVIEPADEDAAPIALDPTKTYRLATTSYLASGALSYHSLRDAKIIQKLDLTLSELFTEYFTSEIGAVLTSANQVAQTEAAVVAQQAPAAQQIEYGDYAATATIDPLSTYTHVCYRCKLTKKDAEEPVQPPAPEPGSPEGNEPINPPVDPSPEPEPAPPAPPAPPVEADTDSE
ncbi:MAG: 5'-nucleotidase C-terminal domain-containing protein [Eubacteriales bacterium]|nr:5'-nucleotidase C-terminal domain-containing protein [Eubacteriales bacterium]